MKRMKKFLGVIATAAMVIALAVPAEMQVQAKPAPYKYQVRIFAGKRGEFKEGDAQVQDYTEKGRFNISDIKVAPEKDESGAPLLNDDGTELVKYYVKGIKESGKDLAVTDEAGENGYALTSFETLDSDKDYVVVYDVLKDPVGYTVRYVDAAGNELAESTRYVANIGDKPIVPYLYIDGYMPNAYNLTKTLSADESRNVFTFTYRPLPTGENTVITTEEVVTTTNQVPGQTIVEGGEGAVVLDEGEGGGLAVLPGDDDAAGGEGGGAEAGGEPEELVDLDDEEVPLANVPGGNGSGTAQPAIGTEPGSFFVNMPPAVIVGITSMAVLVVAAAWFLLFKRKKGTVNNNDGQK